MRSEVRFIDSYPHWFTRRAKKAIHIVIRPNNINMGSGIEIPEAWRPTSKQHNSRPKWTYEGTPHNNRNNNQDRNAANQRATNSDK